MAIYRGVGGSGDATNDATLNQISDLSNAAAVSAAAALASENAAAADEALTNQDTLDTAADVVLTNADVVLTNADAASTAAALDEFTDTYLGAKASAPTLDNDSNALIDGALYFDTTINALYAYDLGNTTWVAAAAVSTATVESAGALMDSEVTNLAAVKAFAGTDYATAAQGTTADAALPKAGGAMTGGVTGMTSLDIAHTATAADEHAVEIVTDAAGFGDVKSIEHRYTTGAMGANTDVAVSLIEIDETSATGGEIHAYSVIATDGAADDVYALLAAATVHPVHQLAGVFANPVLWSNNGVDETTEVTGAGTSSVFVADNDTVLVTSATAFEEIEVELTTGASGNGVAPTFEFSTGTTTFAAFTPIDGTDGFKNTGVIVWDAADTPGFVANTSGNFEIRITRTKNSVTTTPIVDTAKVAAVTEYHWDKSGNLSVNDITVAGTVDGRDVAADGVTADAALPKAGGAMTGAITTNSTFDGRDVAADGTKLDGITVNAALSRINRLPDSGRESVNSGLDGTIVGTYKTSALFNSYNGSVFTEGGKFIHNNNNNGGAAGTMNADAVSFTTFLGTDTQRYGVEYYITTATAGTSTTSPNVGDDGTTRYLLSINNSLALGNNPILEMVMQVKSGSIHCNAGHYKNDVLQGAGQEYTSADGVFRFRLAHTPLASYASGFPLLYATASAVMQYALPVLSNDGRLADYGHTFPIPSYSDVSALGENTFDELQTFANIAADNIAFPATQVASADANTLDDYEEGTWTPALSGSVTAGNTTYTSTAGSYEKIGRQVTAHGRMVINVKGTIDGGISITGLPFTSSATANNYGIVSFGVAISLSVVASESLCGWVDTSSTTAGIRIWSSASGAGSLDDANLLDGTNIMFVITYHV